MNPMALFSLAISINNPGFHCDSSTNLNIANIPLQNTAKNTTTDDKMRSTICVAALFLAPLSALAGPTPDTQINIIQREPTFKSFVGRSAPTNILARSSCDRDEKKCGNECFPESYDCCPNEANIGCPSDQECQRDRGRYGCCPEGETCHWDADDNHSDHDSVFDKAENFKDDVKDKWDDFWDNAGPNLKPELITIAVLAGGAALGLVV